jgi:hypothetical protein
MACEIIGRSIKFVYTSATVTVHYFGLELCQFCTWSLSILCSFLVLARWSVFGSEFSKRVPRCACIWRNSEIAKLQERYNASRIFKSEFACNSPLDYHETWFHANFFASPTEVNLYGGTTGSFYTNIFSCLLKWHTREKIDKSPRK